MVWAISRARANAAAAVVGDFLHQADAVRLGGVELVAGEQPPHRVTPSALAGKPQRRAAERIDATLHLELGEAGARRRDADVGGQQQFDAQRHAPTVRRGDQRRGPRTVQAPRVSPVVGQRQIAGRDVGTDIDQVQTAGEVLAVREQHAGAHRCVGLQQSVGAGQVGEHRLVEGVALVRSIQPDQQDVTVPLKRHGFQVRECIS